MAEAILSHTLSWSGVYGVRCADDSAAALHEASARTVPRPNFPAQSANHCLRRRTETAAAQWRRAFNSSVVQLRQWAQRRAGTSWDRRVELGRERGVPVPPVQHWWLCALETWALVHLLGRSGGSRVKLVPSRSCLLPSHAYILFLREHRALMEVPWKAPCIDGFLQNHEPTEVRPSLPLTFHCFSSELSPLDSARLPKPLPRFSSPLRSWSWPTLPLDLSLPSAKLPPPHVPGYWTLPFAQW